MADKLELPQDSKLASKIIDAQSAQASRRDDMGWLGVILGGAGQKAGNAAGFAIFFASIMLAIVVFYPPTNPATPASQLYTLFSSIITLALGYLFGKHQ